MAALYNGFFQTDQNYWWWVDFFSELKVLGWIVLKRVFHFSSNNLFLLCSNGIFTVFCIKLAVDLWGFFFFFLRILVLFQKSIRELICSNLTRMHVLLTNKKTHPSVRKRNVINPAHCLKCYAILNNCILSRDSMRETFISVRGLGVVFMHCGPWWLLGIHGVTFKLLLFCLGKKIMQYKSWSKSFLKSLLTHIYRKHDFTQRNRTRILVFPLKKSIWLNLTGVSCKIQGSL